MTDDVVALEYDVSTRQIWVLLLSILVVALCGIAYELIIAAVSSYLLGNSVYQFSITIGFFMFAMGIGSYFSKFVETDLIGRFILVEILISIIGGLCSLSLFVAFSQLNAFYALTMYGFILVIGIMVGLEIPILTRIVSQKEHIQQSIANVLSLDYIGALIGSVMFPLLLLPHLGLIRSSFAIGLMNILVAMINIMVFGHLIKYKRRLMWLSWITLLALIALTVFGTQLTRFAEHHLYFDEVIYEKQTPYQRIIVTQSLRNQNHRLYIDGHIQFSERDEYRYHEALVHPVMSIAGKRDHVLILGGGDGMAAREVLKYADVELIHLVDIDPAITDFSRRYAVIRELNQGSLDDPKLTIFNIDAFIFINQPGILYDRVIIDMPDPHNEALNKLYAKEFYRMIKRRMSPNAVLISQSSSPFFTRRTFWSIQQTLEKVFQHTHSFHITVPAFGIWGFNMARLGEPIPTVFEVDVPTRFLTAQVMHAAAVFGKDISALPVPVNSIMEPKLYSLYLQDLSD